MQSLLNIGVDVSKAKVDVFVQETGARLCLKNRGDVLDKWLMSLPGASRIAMEASGQYHELLAQCAHAKGMQVFVLNPKRIRHYARCAGLRAKTDRVDAQLIARYLSKEHAQLHRYTPSTQEQRELQRLLGRRAKAVSMRQAAKASFEDLKGLHGELDKLLECLEGLIAEIDQRLSGLLRADAQRQQAAQNLQSIDGVGLVVSAALLSSLERIPFRSADAFVAYHGLDTIVDESGTRVGRRRLSKNGPAEPRRLLYNAAMAASRTKSWKAFYEHYLQRGWPRTAALMILARRILRTAWSIYKYNTPFDPTRLSRVLT